MLLRMVASAEIEKVTETIFVWHVYDPAVKAELFSTNFRTSSTSYIIDPIPLRPDAWETLPRDQKAAAIVVTNANHARASVKFARSLSAPVYVHQALLGSPEFPGAIGIPESGAFSDGVTTVPIAGAPSGEIALHLADEGGTLVVGDALINFGPSGFDFLPAKYCSDQKQIRQSLRKLLDFSFERLFFAHGTPILSRPRAQLEQLFTKSR